MALTREQDSTVEGKRSRQRLLTLTAVLTFTAMATGAVGVFFMYQIALQQSRHALRVLAATEARLILTAAQQVPRSATGPEAADAVLRKALANLEVMPKLAAPSASVPELLVLRQRQGQFYRLLLHTQEGTTWYEGEGMPLTAAERQVVNLVSGQETVSLVTDDGSRMMVAFVAMPALDAGVMVRLPLHEVIEPLFAAMMGSMGFALLLILFSATVFMRKLNPVLLHVERSEARLRSILGSAAEGIITIDDSGRIIEFNRAAEEIFGYSAAEAIGQPLELIIPPPFQARHQGYISRYLAGGEAKRLRQRTEFQGVRRDGTPFAMELAVSEAWVGKQRLFTGIVTDVTARQEAEDALYEAKAELERRVTERTAELLHNNQLLRAMHETQESYFLGKDSKGVFSGALARLCTLAGGTGGFLAELPVAERGAQCWCYLATQESVTPASILFDRPEWPSWWRSVAEKGQSEVIDDGTAVLLPLKSAGRTMGVAVVTGGAEACTLAVADWLKPYLNVCGTLIHQEHLRRAGDEARIRLIAAERQLDSIISNVQDVIFRTDMAGALRWVSPSIATLSGRAPAQVLGWNVASHMVEHDIVERLHAALQQGNGTVRDFEAQLRHLNGNVLWISANCHYMYDADGRPSGIEGVLRDVTAYKQAVQRVAELNRLYGVLREASRAVVDITERERLYQAICRSLTTTGGFVMAWIGELDGVQQKVVPVTYDGFENGYLQVLRTIAIADPVQGRGPTAQAILNQKTTVVNDIATDPRMEAWRDAALSRGYRSSVALPFHNGGTTAGALMVYAEMPEYFTADRLCLLAILADDISHALDVQGKEKERQAATERLRDLAAHLETVREHERAHLAREIHDDMGGILTAVKMDLAWLKRRLGAEGEQYRNKLNATTQLTDGAIQAMRRIITELRPSILDDLGLIPAVEWQLNEFHKRTGIATSLRLGDTPDVSVVQLSDDLAVAAFRTLQEALTNVVKHAAAQQVVVNAYLDGTQFVLEVADDGCGVDQSPLRKHGSYGILGMRERAHALGGSLDIRPASPHGLSVVLRLPLVGSNQEEFAP